MSTCPSRSTGAYAMHGAASGKYTLELYDRSSAPLELKTWMLRAEVLEILLYGCATWSSRTCHNDTLRRDKHRFLTCYIFFFFSSFSFISLIADGPHHYHPACGHKGSSHLSLVHALQFFLSRCKFSTLTTRQPMVEFYLLTFPRFPLRKKEHKSYLK